MNKKVLKFFSVILSVLIIFSSVICVSAASKKKVDIAFVIDTTGSMEDDIDEVKNNMKSYLNDLTEDGMDYRVAIVDYRDFPSRTDYSADYPYKVQLNFSSSASEITDAINGLSLGNGGDTPETLYSALIDGLDELSWRKEAGKAAIVMGDAPALDPEPITGYTMDMVADKMLHGTIGLVDEIKKSTKGSSAMDVEIRGTITLFTIATSSREETRICFEALAEKTKGKSYTAETTADISSIIEMIIEDEIPTVVEKDEDDGNKGISFSFNIRIPSLLSVIKALFKAIKYVLFFEWLF